MRATDTGDRRPTLPAVGLFLGKPPASRYKHPGGARTPRREKTGQPSALAEVDGRREAPRRALRETQVRQQTTKKPMFDRDHNPHLVGRMVGGRFVAASQAGFAWRDRQNA